MGFTMDQLNPSKYIKGSDVTPPVVATIANVTIETMENRDGETQKKGVVYWVGTLRPMPLNVTNTKTLVAAFGDNSDWWIGKQIEIYFDPSLVSFGEVKGGIRFRLPNGSPATAPRPTAAPGMVWTYAQAQAFAANVGISKADLVAQLKADGETGWNDVRGTAIAQRMIAAAIAAQAPATVPTAPDQGFDENAPSTDGIPF